MASFAAASGPKPGPPQVTATAQPTQTQSHTSRLFSSRLRQRKKNRAATSTTLGTIQSQGNPLDDLDDLKIVVNIEKVLKAVYPFEVETISELDDFDYDSLTPYFIPKSDEKAAVIRELERFTKIVENPDVPLIFKDGSRLGKGNVKGYKALEILTQTIFSAFNICNLDNDGISLVYANLGLTPQKFQKTLDRVLGDDVRKISRWIIEKSDESVWKTEKELFEDAVSLLDFVSGCLARFMCQIARGEYWRNNMLGPLAKFIVKAKFLLKDLEQYKTVACRNGEMAMATFHETYGESFDAKEMENLDPNTVYQKFAGTFIKGSALSSSFKNTEYCVYQQRVRVGFTEGLQYILVSLLPGSRHAGYGTSEYEICGVVTETGFHDFKTFLFQDRDFEFTSTSDLDQLNFAHPAFRLLDASISHLIAESKKAKPNPPPSANAPSEKESSTRTIVEWQYSHTTESDEDNLHDGAFKPVVVQKETHELRDMNDIITIMVLLAMATPVVSGRFKRFLDMFYLTADADDVVRPFPEVPFNAFVRMYTNDFETARRRRHPTDVLKLAEAVNSGLFSRTSLLNTGGANDADTRKRVQELKRSNELMDGWTYTEDAVVVQCRMYVSIVAAGGSVLVAGGLAIGLCLNDRLRGVDPFNITVYAWALAAFIVLVCKAILVENWSWSDFLHGCVKCRSVTELKAVTGIGDQLIIAKLLHDEQESVLKTRGPYNHVFLRKLGGQAAGKSNGDGGGMLPATGSGGDGGGGGFSIDVPVTTKTLLLSGLSMLKVETPLGHALVCLDARRGTELSVVEHRWVGKDEERLMCSSIDRLAQRAAALAKRGGGDAKRHGGASKDDAGGGGGLRGQQGSLLKLPLKSGKLEWRKVEGVYNVLDAVFV